jgi:hypothetical protein
MTPRAPALRGLTRPLILFVAPVALALALGWVFAPDPAPTPSPAAIVAEVPIAPAAVAEVAEAAPSPAPILTAAVIDPVGESRLSVVARKGRRNMAWNLGEVSYWSTQQPFLDAMRSSQTWVGHLPGQWGGWGEAELAAAGALDDDGWIRSVPSNLTHVSTMVFAEMPAEMTSFAGRWIARWEGSAALGFAGAARNVRYDGSSASFDFTPGQGAVIIEFRRGDLRNLTIVQDRHLEAFDEGTLFHPAFVARIGDAENLRFMDWMRTNNSTLVGWDDRPRIHDYSWERRGVPLEILIRLANDTGAEPWFTLPHQADDDYIRRFARMVHADLRPDLRAWVEYSNEVWNFSFQQAHWAEEQARARWGREWAWTQFQTVRAYEMIGIWNEVFADAPDRLVRVIATQTGWLGLEDDLLEAPLWRAEDPANPAPWEAFDVYAVTGYFNAELHEDSRQPMIRAWLAESQAAAQAEGAARGLAGPALAAHVRDHRFDLAVQRAGEELIDGRHSGRAEGTVRHLLDTVLVHQAQVARDRGLALVMYEGGTHVVTAPSQHGDTELVAFFDALNHSAPMGQAYRELLAGWSRLTPAPFNAYVAIGAPGIWGAWGALRHQDDDNPRWQALMEMSQR